MNVFLAPPPHWDCGVMLSKIHANGDICEERFELALDGAIEHWGQLYTSLGPVAADVSAHRAGGKILVSVAVRSEFSLPCSRCLEETGLAISGEMRYLFVSRGALAAEDGDDAEIIEIDAFDAEIDLAPCVWEVLVLNLPERVLCREDCLGLCPVCGADRNAVDCGCGADTTDPRLEVLRGLE
jgi:uncharacterized protein